MKLWNSAVDNYFKNRTKSGNGVWVDYLKRQLEPRASDILLCDNNYLRISSDNIMSGLLMYEEEAKYSKKMFANHIGLEDVLLTQSGYMANYGLMKCVSSILPIYIDKSAHPSLWPEKGRIYPWKHNDLNQLTELIKNYGPGAIVVDSLYSGLGDFCDILSLTNIKKTYDCILILDESNTYGVYGHTSDKPNFNNGNGWANLHLVINDVDFFTTSLAKAFDTRAGLIASSKRNIQYINDCSYPNNFSSGLTKSDHIRLQDIFGKMITANDKRERLLNISAILRNYIISLGFKCLKTPIASPIISIEASEEKITEYFRYLERHGVITSVFCWPATPLHTARLRFTVHSEITDTELNCIMRALSMLRCAKL